MDGTTPPAGPTPKDKEAAPLEVRYRRLETKLARREADIRRITGELEQLRAGSDDAEAGREIRRLEGKLALRLDDSRTLAAALQPLRWPMRRRRAAIALHVGAVYAVSVALFVMFVLQLKWPIHWAQWLVVPVVLLVSNVAEWLLHREVLHRPRRNPLARELYKRHIEHHQAYTDRNYTVRGSDDYKAVILPPYVDLVLLVLAAPGAFLIGRVFGANAGWLCMCTVACHYRLYELLHTLSHVPENWFVRHAPVINSVRRHHVAHHDRGLMRRHNLNLTVPFADWLFRSSDLNRGLFGTLFNGYATTHLRKDLRRRAKLPD